MNRDDLIRALRKYCRKRDLPFAVDTQKGKGSHYMVTVGEKRTTVQSHLNPVIVRKICGQLGVNPAEF